GYLNCIFENYEGGPVGIETLSAALSEPRDALEEIVEPYLLQTGFIGRTPRGRVLSHKAYRHLGYVVPDRHEQPQLAFSEERAVASNSNEGGAPQIARTKSTAVPAKS
ncbi:MAG: Holliday junction DNA helicase RuvB C-terminal domain-containing protein, partial [Hyphomicrobiaceae bacterium]